MRPSRYKCLLGGRGSGKSYAIADALLITGTQRKCRILCSREFQISIKESVHYLLAERINALGMSGFYEVQRDRIIGANGTEFIFKGIRHNVNSIKSMAGLTHCWVEEAQTISAESWRVLVPTIRERGSEIWVTFNPQHKTDTVYQEFVEKEKRNAYTARVNWDMNPHFPDVLNEERLDMLATDPDAYQHVWEGGLWEMSDAQVLYGKWVVDEFTPNNDWDGPYYGADWGFSKDPTTLVELWIFEKKLYVYRESYAARLEMNAIASRWLQDCPGCDRYPIRADSARPETISHVSQHGIPLLKSVDKWQGSVEDGISHLRSYEKIVIHPSCRHAHEEARMWRFKVDKRTGEPLRILVSGNDHIWDAARYGLEPMVKRRPNRKRHTPTSTINW